MNNTKTKKKNRLFSLFLALIMVLGMLPAASMTASAATLKGSGTIDDPYVPTDADQFITALYYKHGKYIKLKYSTITYDGGSQWFKMTEDKVFILEGTSTLKQGDAGYPLIIVDGCNLTIEGDGILQYGMGYDPYNEFTPSTQPVFQTANGGSITVNGGTFKEVNYNDSEIHKNDPSGLFRGSVTVNDGLFIPQKNKRNVTQYSINGESINSSYIFGDPQSTVINGGVFENAFFTFKTYAFCNTDDYKLGTCYSGWTDISSSNIKNAVFRFDSSALDNISFGFTTREDYITRTVYNNAELVQTFIKNTRYSNTLLNKNGEGILKDAVISDIDILKDVLRNEDENGHSLDVVFMNGQKAFTVDRITAAGTEAYDGEIKVVTGVSPKVEITVRQAEDKIKEYWDSLPSRDMLMNILSNTVIYFYPADGSSALTYKSELSGTSGNTYTLRDQGSGCCTFSLTLPEMKTGDAYRLYANSGAFGFVGNAVMITAYDNPLTGCVRFVSGATTGNIISVTLADGNVAEANTDNLRYQWQISNDGGTTWSDLTDSRATVKGYVPLSSQVGCQLRLLVSSLDYTGYICSSPITVGKAVNNKMPVTPTLSVLKDEETGYYTTLVIHNYSEDQEYIWYSGPVSDVSDIEWDRTALKLTSGTTTGMSLNSTYYIYTRFKETEGTKAGSQVASNYIRMSDPLYLQRVTLQDYTDSGDFNKIFVPLGESVTVNVNKEPYDARQWSYCTFGPRSGSTDIYTVTDGKSVTDTMPYSITIRGDKVGTAELALYYRSGQSYYGMWSVIVYDPDGEIPSVSFYQRPAYDDITLYVGDSLTPTQQTVVMRPDEANAIYNKFEWYVCGSVSDAVNWTPNYYASSNPYISVDKTTGRVTALQDTSALTGRYSAYRNVVLYAVNSDGNRVEVASYAVDVKDINIPISSVTITPAHVKMEPGASMTLSAVISPANATGAAVTWSVFSGTGLAAVDENGKVTVSPDAPNGSTVVIRAVCGDLYSDCTVEISELIFGIEVTGGVACADGGSIITEAAADTKISLKADNAPEGKVFDRWVVSGSSVSIEDASSAETCFIMPGENVSLTATYRDAESTILRGDANGDGKISLMDVNRIIRYLAGWSVEINLENADYDANGKVNLIDVSKLIKLLAGS